jgi:hypothetical protein
MKRSPLAQPALPKPFWQRLLTILGVDSFFVLSGALLLRSLAQISNLFFISSIVLFTIAALPIFGEVGGRAKAISSALKDGEKVGARLKEKQAEFDQGARITYVFGLAGLIVFLLSILTIGLG